MRRAIAGHEHVREVAREVHRAQNMLYIGRGPDHATAVEGAMKMKEISYIHAEGYAAGEIKHGLIALVSWDVPTVAILGQGEARAKMLANVREVRARDGLVIAVAREDDAEVAEGRRHGAAGPGRRPVAGAPGQHDPPPAPRVRGGQVAAGATSTSRGTSPSR